jgi:4-hydroxy-2-oxoglutarate aldolase
MRIPPTVMPAIITPFGEDEAIDPSAHAHNVARMWDRGIGGVVIGGSNGEGPYLGGGERRLLAEEARNAVPEIFVMVGVAAESERAARASIAEAEQAGADAVLVMTPTTLVRHRADLIEAFYSDLAEVSRLPIFLYSVPRVTAYDLPLDIAIRLAEHPNIAGIKDSGGDAAKCAAMAAGTGEGFLVFCGASAAIVEAVAGGAHGAITASTNYAPELVADVVAQTLPEAQARLTPLTAAVEGLGVPSVKYAAGRVGFQPGVPRRPLRPLTSEQEAVVDDALSAAGLI